MVKRLFCVFFVLIVFSGCSGSGEYYTSEPHGEKASGAVSTTNSYDITGYYSLKGALLNMVSMGVSSDVLRIGSYSGNLEEDLQTVISEITTEEPIGIYGVLSINVDQAHVLTYREVSVDIQYKRTAAEMRGILSVSSEYDLRNRLINMFETFSEKSVFLIEESVELECTVEQEVYSAWMECGEYAVGLDRVSCTRYPEDGESYVLEIDPSYASDPEQLGIRADTVRSRADEICVQTDGGYGVKADFINSYLYNNISYDQNARRVVNEALAGQPKTSIYTAYGALFEGNAAQSGLVLAASVMCDSFSIEHNVVTGQVGGDIYSWIEFEGEDGEYIFDVTALQNGRETYLYLKTDVSDVYIPWQ